MVPEARWGSAKTLANTEQQIHNRHCVFAVAFLSKTDSSACVFSTGGPRGAETVEPDGAVPYSHSDAAPPNTFTATSALVTSHVHFILSICVNSTGGRTPFPT